jgi:uncharacterized protein YcbX
MHVDQIWRYPVKSMVGGTVPAAALDAQGIVGDRTWAVRDQVRGGIRGAKVLGGLMRLSARYADEAAAGDPTFAGGTVEITLPDGTVVSTDDPGAAAAVSAAIGHEVTLDALRPADDLDHFRRGAAYHDLSQFPPEVLEFESPPGTYYDVHPLLVLTTSALRSLRAALPGSAVDIRRFRPSLVVDSGDAPGHPELAWVGRRLQVGEAVLSVVGPCPRCVMVTREIDAAAPQDRTVLRHIVRDLDQNLGVYATVETPATVHRGDAVTLLD